MGQKSGTKSMMKKEGCRTKRQKGFLICGGERRRGQSCGLASEPASDCWSDLMAPWWLSSRERGIPQEIGIIRVRLLGIPQEI